MGQCERDPQCVRGLRHEGRGGHCSLGKEGPPHKASSDEMGEIEHSEYASMPTVETPQTNGWALTVKKRVIVPKENWSRKDKKRCKVESYIKSPTGMLVSLAELKNDASVDAKLKRRICEFYIHEEEHAKKRLRTKAPSESLSSKMGTRVGSNEVSNVPDKDFVGHVQKHVVQLVEESENEEPKNGWRGNAKDKENGNGESEVRHLNQTLGKLPSNA